MSVPKLASDRHTLPEVQRHGSPLGLLRLDEFIAGAAEPEYIVEGVVSKGQPLVLGGPSKVLKTQIAVDLATSVVSGSSFLGSFKILERMPVGMFSCESGAGVLRAVAEAVLRAKGVDRSTCDKLYLSDQVPKLPHELKLLRSTIQSYGLGLVIIDPVFLSFAGCTSQTSNVLAMGVLLGELTSIGRDTGCTLVLLHHTTKDTARRTKRPVALEDLSQAGFAEWMRQWILVNRREPYKCDGKHSLWLKIGGSAGHSSEWKLSVAEFDTSRKRQWQIKLASNDGYLDEEYRSRRDVEKVLVALASADAPLTKRQLRDRAGYNGKTAERLQKAIEQLLAEGRLVGIGDDPTHLKYQLAKQSNVEANGTGLHSIAT